VRFISLHNLDHNPGNRTSPSNEPACIATVGPDQLDIRKRLSYQTKNQLSAFAILHAASSNHRHHKQADGVHYDMSLAPIDLFPSIVTTSCTSHSVGPAQ
jgi:hypothetical protein